MTNEITFAPHKWLNNTEIDWALSQLNLSNKHKVLPVHQFHRVIQNLNTNEPDSHLFFTELLKQLNAEAELVFIPINNSSIDKNYQRTHWSLLVYRVSTKTFCHYDTLKGANYEYVKPLVKELLKVQGIIKKDWIDHLILRHGIRQKNIYDCGIYVINFVRIISEDGDLSGSKVEQIDPEKERSCWRNKVRKMLENNNEKNEKKNNYKYELKSDGEKKTFNSETNSLVSFINGNRKKESSVKGCLESFLPAFETRANYRCLDINAAGGSSFSGMQLSLTGFVNLERLNCPHNRLGELNVRDCSKLEFLNCSYNQLKKLDLSNCQQLKEIYCADNQLTALDLTGLNQLEKIECSDNFLTKFDYSTLNSQKLTYLNISDNVLSPQNISVFSNFINLEFLWIGSESYNKNEGFCNDFCGSLSSLSPCTKLSSLFIGGTDINFDLENLPDSAKTIYCSVVSGKTEDKDQLLARKLTNSESFTLYCIKEGNYQIYKKENWTNIHPDFAERLDDDDTYQEIWERFGFTRQEAETWIESSLEPKEYEYALQLKRNGVSPEKFVADKFFEAKSDKTYIMAQEYLDQHYLKSERFKVKQLLISGFDYEKWEEKVGWKKLRGGLSLNDFINLEVLLCDNNQISSLNLEGLKKLSTIYCNSNYISRLEFSSLEPKNLVYLNIANNNLHKSDLSVFREFIGLETLYIGNSNKEKIENGIYNRFHGSLEHIKDLTKLKRLSISNTDISSGQEFLSKNLIEFHYSSDLRPESEMKDLNINKKAMNIVLYQNQLENAENEIINDLFHYEDFSDIEEIGRGGYGIVYKANMKNQFNPVVALKVLFNKDIDQKKLFQEFANHKTITSRNVLGYYGFSYDSIGNYVIVMKHCDHRSIRNYLSKENCTLLDKISFLLDVVDGMQNIHGKGLVHRDLHPGNILISSGGGATKFRALISDLGLSELSYVENKGRCFGVLPYIAPEVLCRKPYTQAADVYSLSMIIYEMLTGYIPFYNQDWDDSLSSDIALHNVRPEITVKLPEQLVEIIKSCWEEDPHKRITAQELSEKIRNSLSSRFLDLLLLPEYNHPYQNNLQCHPSVSLTSKQWKLIDKLRKKIQDLSISGENSIINENKEEVQILEVKLNSLKTTLTEDQQHFFIEFVNLRKEFAKDRENKEIREKIKSLSKLMKNMFSKEVINEIIESCDEIVRLENERIKEEVCKVIEQPTKQITK